MHKPLENDFTQIPNKIIRDKTISTTAKAVYLTLCWTPPNWEYSIYGLSVFMGIGKNTVMRAIKDLVDSGYIISIRTRRTDGKYGNTRYEIVTDREFINDTSKSGTGLSNPDITKSQNEDINTISNENNNRKNNSPISNYRDNNTLDNTCCLTANVCVFEAYLHRKLKPSELKIWKNWQKENVDSQIIRLAVEDNEYRDRPQLSDIDTTIKLWVRMGLTTVKEIKNYILDSKYKNTYEFYKKQCFKTGHDPQTITDESSVGNLKAARDYLMELFDVNRSLFILRAESCPVEVFEYLPDVMLNELIKHFDKNGNENRKQKALQALEV